MRSPNEQSSRPDLVGEFRVKVPLPIVIPLLAVAVIAALSFGFSRVLLTVPKEAATLLALVTAANVLIAAAFVALRPSMHGVGMLEVALIALYPVLIGIVIASTGFGTETEAAAGEEAPPAQEQPGGSGSDITLVASNIQFDSDEITMPAQTEVTMTLDNQDTVQHNVAIYADEADAVALTDPIFQGELIDGGTSTTYEFESPEAGEYFFHCDIHPAMNGTAIVE